MKTYKAHLTNGQYKPFEADHYEIEDEWIHLLNEKNEAMFHINRQVIIFFEVPQEEEKKESLIVKP